MSTAIVPVPDFESVSPRVVGNGEFLRRLWCFFRGHKKAYRFCVVRTWKENFPGSNYGRLYYEYYGRFSLMDIPKVHQGFLAINPRAREQERRIWWSVCLSCKKVVDVEFDVRFL